MYLGFLLIAESHIVLPAQHAEELVKVSAPRAALLVASMAVLVQVDGD